MVSHNTIPNGHFHKNWQSRVRTGFAQPMQKSRRRLIRIRKVIAIAPQPLQKLRPVVHCPSFRYHSRVRVGRGFSLQELKRAGINKRVARTIGIVVDYRRKNRSVESIFPNVRRLKEYRARVIFMSTASCNGQLAFQQAHVNIVRERAIKTKARKVTDDDVKFEAYSTLRKARIDVKLLGKRLKRKLAQAENV